MIWLTWRQHRTQMLYALIGLAVLAAFVVPTGLAMRDFVTDSGLGACVDGLGNGAFVPMDAQESCFQANDAFDNRFSPYLYVATLFLALPVVIGLFWGAPMVSREVEQGTHRLVWTQGVSPRRWALVKFGLVGLAALVFSVVYALGVSWWAQPLATRFGGTFTSPAFDVQGIVPIGYTLFALALGIFAGTLWRRSLAAMAATLVAFVAVRVAVLTLARPRFLSPEERTYSIRSDSMPNEWAGDWVMSAGVRAGDGTLLAADARILCPPEMPTDGCGPRLGAGLDSYNWELYQPADRYWLFQYIEVGIYVALGAILIALAVRRLRKIT